MFTFSLILMPLALAFYFLQTERKVNIILLITGLISAVLVFALKEFFTLSHRIVPLSFSTNFLYLFFRETLIPCGALYGIFWLSSKDDTDFKCNGFFPLTASFYAVYLPYIIINSPEATTAFEILGKPLLYLVMLVSVAHAILLISRKTKVSITLGILIILFTVTMPSVCEALFLINAPAIFYILLTTITILLPFAGLIIHKLKK